MTDTGPPTAKQLWGDEKYADATVIMGPKLWRIHQWVVCQQSDFLKEAFEGPYKESTTKTIDLSDRDVSPDGVHMMLKFLYTHELDHRQKADPVSAAIIADHFKVKTLRARVLQELKCGLRSLIVGGSFANFKVWALRILDEHADTEIERALVEGTAASLQDVIHNRVSPSTWSDIVQKHPAFANKIILALYPKPVVAAGPKLDAGTAIDDEYAI